MAQRNHPSIVVVGAGVSGLAAAKKLKEHGFDDVTVLEASEKVGGRVAIATIGNTCVDSGAQYIHGASEMNPVFRLFKTSGLLSQVPEMEAEVFYSNKGHKVDAIEASHAYEAGEGILRYRGSSTGKSLGEHFAEQTQGVIDKVEDNDRKTRMQSVLALVGKDMLVDIGASDLHSVSLDSWQYYINMGDSLNVAGLMLRLVDMLQEDFPKDRVLLKREVSQIRWNGSFSAEKLAQAPPLSALTEAPPPAALTEAPPPAALTEAPPSAALTEAPPPAALTEAPPPAALTEAPPLAALTEAPPLAALTEAPPLAALTEAPPLSALTEAVSEGNVRHYPVCVVYENGEEFLADHVIVTVSLGCLKARASSLFSPSLPAEKTEAIHQLCFGNIAKIFLQYEQAFWGDDVSSISLVYEDDSPATVSTNKTQWVRNVQSFSVMRPKERFGNMLIGWCPGNIADLIETMTEKELSSALTEHLRMFLGNSDIPQPKSVLCTQWRSNRLIQGSYTFLPVGVDGRVMDTLAEPLGGSQDLKVMFGGEATIKTLYGTLQGALLSGHREADRLAVHYKTSSAASADKQV